MVTEPVMPTLLAHGLAYACRQIGNVRAQVQGDRLGELSWLPAWSSDGRRHEGQCAPWQRRFLGPTFGSFV